MYSNHVLQVLYGHDGLYMQSVRKDIYSYAVHGKWRAGCVVSGTAKHLLSQLKSEYRHQICATVDFSFVPLSTVATGSRAGSFEAIEVAGPVGLMSLVIELEQSRI